jgi:hypothetical protein
MKKVRVLVPMVFEVPDDTIIDPEKMEVVYVDVIILRGVRKDHPESWFGLGSLHHDRTSSFKVELAEET